MTSAEDDDFIENRIAYVCGGSDATRNTLDLVKRCLAERVPGDFAEVGVCAGTHPAVMAYALTRYGDPWNRKIHLFDSFESGFTAEPDYTAESVLLADEDSFSRCEPSARDPVMTSVRQVRDNMSSWGADRAQLVYHVGWVQETLPALGRVPLALLRVDVDLVHPNYAVFKYLYDMVSPGGYIISDDWGPGDSWAGGRLAAYRFFSQRNQRLPEVEPVVSGTVWWRK